MPKAKKNKAISGLAVKAPEARYRAFVDAYLANGRNATQAAITAGYSPKTAYAQGARLLRKAQIAAAIDAASEKAQAASGLTVERTLREVARVAYFDPRKLFRGDGSLKDPSEWDDDTAAAVAAIEGYSVKAQKRGKKSANSDEADDASIYGMTKVKLWDKNAALEKAMKHLGLYERDNAQRAPDLALQVVLIGPP